VAVAPQHDSTHGSLHASDYDAVVDSFLATFGGQSPARLTSSRAVVEFPGGYIAKIHGARGR
jgi:hypothetical protein